MQKHIAASLASLLVASQVAYPGAANAAGTTATPIKHVVVIFGENISFDHYFGTYPNATNPPNEPAFHAKPGTPAVNGFTDALLFNNPNFLNKTGNGAAAFNPFRLDRRPGPRLHARAAGLPWRPDGLVPGLHRHCRTAARRPEHHRPGDGLL